MIAKSSPRRSRKSTARALLGIFALAAFAAPNQALAQFGSTKLTPPSQTVNVGTPFTVNVVFTEPAGGYVVNGIQAWVKFDPTKLQVASVATGGSSPYTSVFANQFDNTLGTLIYGATGGSPSGTFTVATITFTPIGAGTSALFFQNVNEFIVGYGPFGVNGLATGASVTVNNPAPTQTLTILGASGNIGDVAANVEYYNPGTGDWQPAYVANYAPYGHPVTHPWGNVAGTNHWVNYRTDGASDPRPLFDTSTYWYLYRVRFTVPADAQNATMTFSLKADNRAQVAINGVNTGPEIVGQANGVNADAVFSQNLHPGENTITLNVGDEGGLNGFNFRLDLSVQSSQPLVVVQPVSDTTPPVITAPINIVREATSADGAVVTFTATALDAVDGPVVVVANPVSGSTFPIATTPVGLAATDAAGNDATASFLVKVQDTTKPVLTVPAAVTAEATGASGATVSYPAATATDAVGVTSLIYSQDSGTLFPLGTTTVNVTAKDAAGNTSDGSFTITVVDTTKPAIASVTRSSATLWPPNHQMVPITVSAVVSDAVGSSLKIVNVTSSEPDNGLGDGDTANDIQITGNLTVNLRAERSGKGNGRVYTITLEARDAAGNTSQATCTVSVPKSQGGK